MKAVCYAALLLAVPASANNSVNKVITMLQEMKATATKDMNEAEVLFAEQQQWCADTKEEKTAAINNAVESIEQLKATSEQARSDEQNAQNEVSRYSAAINQAQADKKASEDRCAKDQAECAVTRKDYQESVDALGRAIQVLKRQAFDRPQAGDNEMLLQIAANPMVPNDARKQLEAFVQGDGDTVQGEANAYEFQSQGVVEMLQNLEEKFIEELHQHNAGCLNSKNAAQMVQMDLDGQIDMDTAAKGRQEAAQAAARKKAAAAESEQASTENTLAADRRYLADCMSDCKLNKENYDANLVVRQGEIEALGKAIEIMSSSAVSTGAGYTMVQKGFVQVATLSHMSPKQDEASTYLLQQSQKYKSKILEELSDSVAADPFNKVKKMIRSMVDKLQKQALEEAEHKGFCDKEMGSNKLTRQEKESKVAELTAERDEQSAMISKLASEIEQLEADSNAMTKALSEATKLRGENKAENEKTIEESKQAQVAVQQALTVLQNYYDNPSGAFLQQNEDADEALLEIPGDVQARVNGQQDKKTGVLALMQQILEDFARVESDAMNAEQEQKREFTAFKRDTEKNLAVNSMSVENKTGKKERTEGDMAKTVRDLEGTQEELDAANRYYDKLKPSCVHTQPTHEERMAKRQAEINSLKEALRILQ